MTAPSGQSAYSPYELLRTLIERVGWPDGTQKDAALRSVDAMENMQIFGNLASMMQCPHEQEARFIPRYGTLPVCRDCGKQNP